MVQASIAYITPMIMLFCCSLFGVYIYTWGTACLALVWHFVKVKYEFGLCCSYLCLLIMVSHPVLMAQVKCRSDQKNQLKIKNQNLKAAGVRSDEKVDQDQMIEISFCGDNGMKDPTRNMDSLWKVCSSITASVTTLPTQFQGNKHPLPGAYPLQCEDIRQVHIGERV